jgi:hypothetical protein
MMISALLSQIEAETGASRASAGRALGLLVDASRRQGGGFGLAVCAACPDILALANAASFRLASVHANPTEEVISSLIEATPGGRRHVAARTLDQLRREGFGPVSTARLVQIMSGYAQATLGLASIIHLGALFGGSEADTAASTPSELRRSA